MCANIFQIQIKSRLPSQETLNAHVIRIVNKSSSVRKVVCRAVVVDRETKCQRDTQDLTANLAISAKRTFSLSQKTAMSANNYSEVRMLLSRISVRLVELIFVILAM